jgi:hypothetical protein
VVIDEAHRLRNVYKPSNVIANTLKLALAGKHKLLLTATPLQNSLLELVRPGQLHRRAHLRRPEELPRAVRQSQSGAGVPDAQRRGSSPSAIARCAGRSRPTRPYTKRLPMVEEFTPEESEDRLYHLVSEYLQRDNLQALPPSQRSLMTLVLRKLLASSTFAIAGALTSISNRLKAKLRKHRRPAESLEDELDQDYEPLTKRPRNGTDDEPSPDRRRPTAGLEQEIADLDAFAATGTSIRSQRQGQGAAQGAGHRLRQGARNSAREKAIIFTESRKTQSYLLRVLADSPFRDGIVLFNGSNTDDSSKLIYARGWSAIKAATRSPARAPPTCARRWWITSASRAAS